MNQNTSHSPCALHLLNCPVHHCRVGAGVVGTTDTRGMEEYTKKREKTTQSTPIGFRWCTSTKSRGSSQNLLPQLQITVLCVLTVTRFPQLHLNSALTLPNHWISLLSVTSILLPLIVWMLKPVKADIARVATYSTCFVLTVTAEYSHTSFASQ